MTRHLTFLSRPNVPNKSFKKVDIFIVLSVQTGLIVLQEVSLGEPVRVAPVLRGTGNLGEGRGALVAASAPGELTAKGKREPRAPESCPRLPGAATSRGTQQPLGPWSSRRRCSHRTPASPSVGFSNSHSVRRSSVP